MLENIVFALIYDTYRTERIIKYMAVMKVLSGWLVDSESHRGKYLVRDMSTGYEKGNLVCTCPDYSYKKRDCKHIFEVRSVG